MTDNTARLGAHSNSSAVTAAAHPLAWVPLCTHDGIAVVRQHVQRASRRVAVAGQLAHVPYAQGAISST